MGEGNGNGISARVEYCENNIQTIFTKIDNMNEKGSGYSRSQTVRINHMQADIQKSNDNFSEVKKEVAELKTRVAQATAVIGFVLVIVNVALKFI